MENDGFGYYIATLIFILALAIGVSRFGDWIDGAQKKVVTVMRCTELGCQAVATERPQ